MHDQELRKRLDKLAYEVTQNKATEPPFSGKLVDNHDSGKYNCIVCGQKLLESVTKFDSGSGWPSFDQAIPGSIKEVSDSSHGMKRTEVVCSNCSAHLGHLFGDGPRETTGQRFCINSCALDFKKK